MAVLLKEMNGHRDEGDAELSNLDVMQVIENALEQRRNEERGRDA